MQWNHSSVIECLSRVRTSLRFARASVLRIVRVLSTESENIVQKNNQSNKWTTTPYSRSSTTVLATETKRNGTTKSRWMQRQNGWIRWLWAATFTIIKQVCRCRHQFVSLLSFGWVDNRVCLFIGTYMLISLEIGGTNCGYMLSRLSRRNCQCVYVMICISKNVWERLLWAYIFLSFVIQCDWYYFEVGYSSRSRNPNWIECDSCQPLPDSKPHNCATHNAPSNMHAETAMIWSANNSFKISNVNSHNQLTSTGNLPLEHPYTTINDIDKPWSIH